MLVYLSFVVIWVVFLAHLAVMATRRWEFDGIDTQSTLASVPKYNSITLGSASNA